MGFWPNRVLRRRFGAGVDVGLGGAELEIIGGAAEDTGRASSPIAI